MDSKANNERLDELFRSKLETFETQAADRAWDKLQKAQRPARKFAVPTRWIAAAAAAGICLGAGFWFSIDREKEVTPAAVADAPVQKKNTDHLKEREELALAEKETQAVVSEHERRNEAPRSMTAEEKSEKEEVVVSSRKWSGGEDSSTTPAELPQLVPGDSDRLSTPASGAGEPSTRVLVVYVTPVPLDETPAVEKESEVVVQAVAAEDAPVKKKRGIQRFFKQLRNAKTGEKVDWEELGLSPQKTYANVEPPVGGRQEHYRIQGEKKGN